MRRIIILFVILLAILGAIISYAYWPSIERRIRKLTFNKEQETKDIKRTQELLKDSKPEEALTIITQYADQVNNNTEDGKEWLSLLISASEALNNTQQLALLYKYFLKAF